ncbi:Stk1 family PASTA domain-containing Ser/Thr kinase [uncultured Eubacterium sp.]|uniref:Stk1 family PASTA domain-containing Ser/Thr kinase n=1 Tax=uncultured Eubacterium sp. TaxID=165185 RepID=UPI0025DC4A22|nr:Stk1 family PASTA domain-containing Ser/Thr kinase [uncultured Eubacterium sp.]
MDNYVGKRLDGRYEIQEIIGVGGMSVVYKAYDNVDDRIVAVKILKEEFLNNDDFKRRFKNESKAIALLSHENIVKVYDVNFGEKLQYIVMEYIDGITLKEFINKQGSITWNDALFFMTQILRAVQHAHDKGIVHRDIKPQNIILLPNGNLKVTDFGIARFSRSDTKTLTEQAIGSVHYISPEQAKGEYTDEKADIYSIGVVLYEMLSGKVPFEADSAVSVALMQVNSNAEDLRKINPDIPLGLEQICMHAMQKNPADRYQSATEMLLDIEEIVKDPNKTFNYVNNEVVPEPSQEIEPIIDTSDEYDEEETEYDDSSRKKKITVAIITGLVVLIAAIVAIIMMFTSGFNTKTQKLENFVGFSYDQLQDNSSYNYEFVAEYEKSDQYDPGTVIKQSPEAGSKVMQGSKVTLIVASSDKDITMPNVYGLSLELAQQTLQLEGLNNFKTMDIASDNVEEGKVIYTDPKATSVVSAEQEVTIYVSAGPTTTVIETLTVPDVSGLTQSGARAFLEKFGFTNISFVTQDNAIKKGVVISQSPAVGSQAKTTDSIKVIISSGITTTSAQAVKYSVGIKLPMVQNYDGSFVTDTLIVKLGKDTYSSRKVTLDGNSIPIDITAENGKAQNIKVSLKSTGVTETKHIDGKKSEDINIDFSAATNTTTVESTQTTTPTTPTEANN